MFTRLLANANDAWEFPSMGKMYEVHCLPVWGGGAELLCNEFTVF